MSLFEVGLAAVGVGVAVGVLVGLEVGEVVVGKLLDRSLAVGEEQALKATTISPVAMEMEW